MLFDYKVKCFIHIQKVSLSGPACSPKLVWYKLKNLYTSHITAFWLGETGSKCQELLIGKPDGQVIHSINILSVSSLAKTCMEVTSLMVCLVQIIYNVQCKFILWKTDSQKSVIWEILQKVVFYGNGYCRNRPSLILLHRFISKFDLFKLFAARLDLRFHVYLLSLINKS